MKEISVAAKLSQIYTNHCIRATSVTLLDRAGIPVHRIIQVSGHRNEGSVKVYCERQTLQQQKQCSEILAEQTDITSSDSMVSTRKPLQQTQNNNKTEIRYQNSFSNTTSPKFVYFGEASRALKTVILRLIITLRNDSDWLANCCLPDEFLLLVSFYIMIKIMNRNLLTNRSNVVFFFLS